MTDAREHRAKNRSSLDLKRREFLKRVRMLGAGVAIADLSLQNSDEPVEAAQTSEDALTITLRLLANCMWVHTAPIKAIGGRPLLIGFLEFVKNISLERHP